jgi:hypothetical protein
MAHISLPYAPYTAPLSIVAPGWFLSAMPATMNQSADGYSYTGSGNSITAWNLYDANNNPIALSTAQQLFGTPVLNKAPGSAATCSKPWRSSIAMMPSRGSVSSRPRRGCTFIKKPASRRWGSYMSG